MKHITKIIVWLLTAVLLFSCAIVPALADDTMDVSVKADFRYDDAKKMLKLINEFRTGKNAWYLDEDNQTKIYVSGLCEMEYDAGLERVAMQRALELAAYFSHTRPDGSAWSTAFPSAYKTKGENLAYGYGSADAAFKALAEEDKDYAGQGHRRNMLRKEFTRVGFGAVKVGNVMYWVQSFSDGSGKTKSADKFKANKVTVSTSLLVKSARGISPETEEVSVAIDESASLPRVVVYSNSGAKLYLSVNSWKSLNKKVAKVKGKNVIGVKKGDAKLEANVGGKTVQLPVRVVKKAKASEITETLEDYEPVLAGGDMIFVLEDDECFEFGEE